MEFSLKYSDVLGAQAVLGEDSAWTLALGMESTGRTHIA